jgi:hypothetical protein
LAISDDLKETWIETRGEGGYFLATPSQGYSIIDGSLKNRQVLTKNERETLHTLARSFTAKLEPNKFDNADKASSTRPGESTIDVQMNQCGVIFLNRKVGFSPVNNPEGENTSQGREKTKVLLQR